jgi:general stress protein CsbA
MLIEINWQGFKRKLVILKFILQRGYGWCNVLMLALIGAGVLKPYFPNWNLFALGGVAFVIIFIIGLIDRYWGLLHEESNFGVEMTPLLMKGLRGELKK